MVRPSQPTADVRTRVERGLGRQTEAWRPASGGFSSAGIWSVAMADGTSVFVKAAVNDLTSSWLRDEYLIYGGVSGPFMPKLELWDDEGPLPILVIEDLSRADWPPPWSAERVEGVLATIGDVAGAACPDALRSAEEHRADLSGWARVAADPTLATASGLCDTVWLGRHLEELLRWEAAMTMEGSALLHFDVRSDNLCFAPEVKLVDWNHACRGNPALDVLGWLPSLHLEGGPAPWEIDAIADDEAASIVATFAGYFVAQAGMPLPTDVRQDIREFQRALGRICLEWAVRVLDISPPPLRNDEP